MRNVIFAVVVAAAAGTMIGCESTQSTKNLVESTPTEMVSTGNGRVYLTPSENSQVTDSGANRQQPYSVFGTTEQQTETHMGQQTGMHPEQPAPANEDQQPPNLWAPNAPR